MQKLFYLLIVLLLFAGCKESENRTYVNNIIAKSGNVYYYMKGLEKPFTVLFLSDTHFTVEDERGREFYTYAQRMGGDAVKPENYGISNGRELAFIASLDKAKKAGSELVLLGGDIVNFPSLASVEHIKRLLDKSGLNYMYIAGNHDWHYEGEPGKASDQRDKWTHSNLEVLYQGHNPMYRSQVIHNVNFVMIDNSTFEITEEQLVFFREQLNKGFPILLSMHIPLYLPGHGVDYGCGSPDWNAKNDCYYEVERREPWPEAGCTETTYQFRDLMFNSPEVIGIYAGHMHEEAMDFFNDKFQYVADANYEGKDILIHFIPYILPE